MSCDAAKANRSRSAFERTRSCAWPLNTASASAIRATSSLPDTSTGVSNLPCEIFVTASASRDIRIPICRRRTKRWTSAAVIMIEAMVSDPIHKSRLTVALSVARPRSKSASFSEICRVRSADNVATSRISSDASPSSLAVAWLSLRVVSTRPPSFKSNVLIPTASISDSVGIPKSVLI